MARTFSLLKTVLFAALGIGLVALFAAAAILEWPPAPSVPAVWIGGAILFAIELWAVISSYLRDRARNRR